MLSFPIGYHHQRNYSVVFLYVYLPVTATNVASQKPDYLYVCVYTHKAFIIVHSSLHILQPNKWMGEWMDAVQEDLLGQKM